MLNDLGEVFRYEGRFDRAREVYEEALLLRRERGDKYSLGGVLHNLGFVVHRQGDHKGAYDIFREGLLLSAELERHIISAGCIMGLGGVAWVLGQPVKATRLLGAAEAIFDAFGAYMWPPDRVEFERFVAGTRETLDEAAWQAAWDEGRAMSMKQAIAYSLEETADG
jgi:tetratricopeptide (TPR) repeat protein